MFNKIICPDCKSGNGELMIKRIPSMGNGAYYLFDCFSDNKLWIMGMIGGPIPGYETIYRDFIEKDFKVT